MDSGEYEIRNKSVDVKVTEEKRIYLDHNATTPIAEEVLKVIDKNMREQFGNPSSIHKEGKSAAVLIESARRSVAKMINCTSKRVVFTGGGSEANNLAIKGAAFANWEHKKHIITSSMEHPSVLAACRWLKKYDFEITELKADRFGVVDPADLEQTMREDTCLVSIMTANNETGAIQPIKELALAAKKKGVLFHTDCVQAIGKISIDVEELGVDMLSMSCHKFYGPKAVGALYIRKGVQIETLVHGGSQEGGMRAGTENLIGITALGAAADIAVQRLSEISRLEKLRDKLEQGIRKLVPDAKTNSHRENCLPNTLNITLPRIRGESLVLALDQRGVSISSGSACRSGSPDPSHSLLAMGLTPDEAHCTIRVSLGFGNTEDEIERTLSLLEETVRYNQSMVRFIPCR